MVDTKTKIFISHNSLDKDVADMLFDFLVLCGIPRDRIFCSSLPGNDVRQIIPQEVKEALKHSCLNIAILSRDYYQSSYCMNETGIFWFQDNPVILLALPEIDLKDMIGFLDSDYIIRRLDSDTDIAYILECAQKQLGLPDSVATIYMKEIVKLKEKYAHYLASRSVIGQSSISLTEEMDSIDMTDNENVNEGDSDSTDLETEFYGKEIKLKYIEKTMGTVNGRRTPRIETITITLDEMFKYVSVLITGVKTISEFKKAVDSYRVGYYVSKREALLLKTKLERLGLIESYLKKDDKEMIRLTELGIEIMNCLNA